MNEVKEKKKKNHYFWVGVVSKSTWNLKKKKFEWNSTKFYMLGKKKIVVLFISSLWERIRDKMLSLV